MQQCWRLLNMRGVSNSYGFIMPLHLSQVPLQEQGRGFRSWRFMESLPLSTQFLKRLKNQYAHRPSSSFPFLPGPARISEKMSRLLLC